VGNPPASLPDLCRFTLAIQVFMVMVIFKKKEEIQ